MANIKISDLPIATAAASADLFAIVQGGVTKQLTNQLLFTGSVLVTPALGTPVSGVLTNCTGLPISTGITGLGTGVATFLATPSSANLKIAVTDETGSGSLVFATSPTLVTPVIGVATGTSLALSGAFSCSTIAASGVATVNSLSSTTSVAGATLAISGASSVGYLNRGAPVTKTADFTVAATENWLINNKSGSTCTVTLPAAASFTGREIMIKNVQTQTVVSASSNVVPLIGGAAGTAILAASAGKWATLVSDGTNWVILAAA